MELVAKVFMEANSMMKTLKLNIIVEVTCLWQTQVQGQTDPNSLLSSKKHLG